MHQKAQILPATPAALNLAANLLTCGDVVGMPTETVYGLAGSVRIPQALEKIFNAKNRPTTDPLIVHVCSEAQAFELVDLSQLSSSIQLNIQTLITRFWPGPLTLILPKHANVPDLATSGLPAVAIRMPRHQVALQLISQVGPLAAPSANRFGHISPTTAQAVFDELGEAINLILDGGPCAVGVESTVLGLSPSGRWTLFRPGGIPVEELETTLNHPVEILHRHKDPRQSPGLLESHYAPIKPLYLLPKPLSDLTNADIPAPINQGVHTAECKKAGLLTFSDLQKSQSHSFEPIFSMPIVVRPLTTTDNIDEAARNLFAEMRDLDQMPEIDMIFCEPTPLLRGLGLAIQDRLQKASFKQSRV